ncbi:MAG: haloacid dehalogenase-like hydrolase [Eubacterium sp.]
MEINIYDFDKTIIPFDSGSLFWGYCILHYPWIIILFPLQLIGLILTLLKIIDFTAFKKVFFLFVALIPLQRAVNGFWDRHEKQVHKWFFNRKRYSVVISASPDFLLDEIHKRLGFEMLICSRHNKKTGAIIGRNCREEEKVKRLYEAFGKENIKVIDVYSDSIKHDRPIFSLGENCYHIVKGERIKFKFDDIYK